MSRYVVIEDFDRSKKGIIKKGTILELKHNDFYLADKWICNKDSYNGTKCIEIIYAHTRNRVCSNNRQ